MSKSEDDSENTSSLGQNGETYEMYDVVSEEGEELSAGPMEWLRDVLGEDQALRSSDGSAENTFIFWFEVGERNGLQWRNINWGAPQRASETDARAVLSEAEELTLQIVPKEDYA